MHRARENTSKSVTRGTGRTEDQWNVRRRRTRTARRPPRDRLRSPALRPTAAITPRQAYVDEQLRHRARALHLGFMAFLELSKEAIEKKHYRAFGYHDPARYFEERIGFSYRTIRRRLAILEAIRGLPANDQEAAKRSLVKVGMTKAAILAPMLRDQPEAWRQVVKWGRRLLESELQRKVTRKLGLMRRGRPAGTAGPGNETRAVIRHASALQHWLEDTPDVPLWLQVALKPLKQLLAKRLDSAVSGSKAAA